MSSLVLVIPEISAHIVLPVKAKVLAEKKINSFVNNVPVYEVPKVEIESTEKSKLTPLYVGMIILPSIFTTVKAE